jgi:hypothetical protein
MTAQEIAHYRAPNLNHLRRGWTYTATTMTGATVGEYLGMEADYGERVVLLRNATGTESISRHDLVSIEVAA